MTISTVNKLLRAEPELKAVWERAQFQQQLNVQRGVWSALGSRHPEKGAKSPKDMLSSDLRLALSK
jgi:hypothetical protein